MAQIKKIDRSDKDLTPKQRMFCDILVANWGEITYAEACKQAKYECANEKDYSAIASRLLNRRLNPHIAKYIQLAGLYVDKREVKVSGLEGMTRIELEKKLKELSKKIDGYNAKTIEIETEDTPKITRS